MKPRFEIRKSPVDGMFRVWEQRMASVIETPKGNVAFPTWGPGDHTPLWDYPIWVTTGVYATRRDIFKARREI